MVQRYGLIIRTEPRTHSRLPNIKLDAPPPDLPSSKVDLRTHTTVSLSPLGRWHINGPGRQRLLVVVPYETDTNVILMPRCVCIVEQSESPVRRHSKRSRLIGRIVCQLVESIVQSLPVVVAERRNYMSTRLYSRLRSESIGTMSTNSHCLRCASRNGLPLTDDCGLRPTNRWRSCCLYVLS